MRELRLLVCQGNADEKGAHSLQGYQYNQYVALGLRSLLWLVYVMAFMTLLV
jgi:hypothetical protein